MSASFLTGFVDQFGEVVEFLGGEFGGAVVQQGGGSAAGGAAEEGFDEMAEGAPADAGGLGGRHVDVAQVFGFVAGVAFFFQRAELGADGGVAGTVRHVLVDFGRGGALAAVEDFHDLPLAAAQVECRFEVVGHMLAFSQPARKVAGKCLPVQ